MNEHVWIKPLSRQKWFNPSSKILLRTTQVDADTDIATDSLNLKSLNLNLSFFASTTTAAVR